MSFFSKLFGGTFESHLNEGNALVAEGRYGEAKLAFDQALSKSKDQPPRESDGIQEKIHMCRVELVKQHFARADLEIMDGDKDRANELLDEAGTICDDPDIVQEIKNRKQHYEAEEARQLATNVEEISEDELLSVIAGTWTEPQAFEYAVMPEAFRQALLVGHDGHHEKAAELLGEIVKRTDLPEKPRYLWFELGRELMLAEKWDEAIGTFETFHDATRDDPDAEEVQITARGHSAQALINLDRFDEAKEMLIEMTDIDPENHNHYLNLGIFLRSRKNYDQSIAALERAVELMGQMHPDFQVIRELGFTHLASGNKQEARANLGAVVEHIASTGRHDQIDPQAGVALATLYEEDGDLRLASDIYRHLAVGYDLTNHFTYNLQAARLLDASNEKRALVERYLTRADELAENKEQNELLQRFKAGSGE